MSHSGLPSAPLSLNIRSKTSCWSLHLSGHVLTSGVQLPLSIAAGWSRSVCCSSVRRLPGHTNLAHAQCRRLEQRVKQLEHWYVARTPWSLVALHPGEERLPGPPAGPANRCRWTNGQCVRVPCDEHNICSDAPSQQRPDVLLGSPCSVWRW